MPSKEKLGDRLKIMTEKSKEKMLLIEHQAKRRRIQELGGPIKKIIGDRVREIIKNLENELIKSAHSGKTSILYELYRERGSEFDEIHHLGGIEFDSKHLQDFCLERGLKLRISEEYTNYINGYYGVITIMDKFRRSIFALISW